MKDQRQLIVTGGDFAERTGATPVMVSHCILTLRLPKYIAECERAFLQFERLLRNRRDEDIKYEWINVFRHGLKVYFEINWYDYGFFQDRKEAYRVGPHPFVFQRFGAVDEDFQIDHRRPNGSLR
jgi:hypothetical protein